MNVEESLAKISKALALLALQTRAENLAGQFSKNRLVEDLLLPLFRVVLDAPQLRNVNQDAANYPCIDLADDSARIAVQVTTERGAQKITSTLTKFVSHGYQKRFSRLAVFLLREEKPRYSTGTKKKWRTICGRRFSFDPAKDIIATLDLFPLIQALGYKQIFQLRDAIAQTVVGEAYVDVADCLGRLSQRQIEHEKRSKKYIPDIFVETRMTKSLARSFAHPSLFFQRTLDSLGRLNIRYWDNFLAKAGLPALPFPSLEPCRKSRTFLEVSSASAQLSDDLAKLTARLEGYRRQPGQTEVPAVIDQDHRAFYEENVHNFELGLSGGLKYQLDDLLNELALARKRILILTGRAGQGKTNFVCDFVEKFLLKHEIPCAYLSARQLRASQSSDLGEIVQRSLFEGATPTFAAAARRISAFAEQSNKPFVLIIDGINEHSRINAFADELQNFAESMMEYPGLKLLLTCRSEFFQQRFGSITSSSLAPQIYLLESNKQAPDDDARDELVDGYFRFFKLQRNLVSDHVVDVLQKDVLLLRFFCEAYGAKDKPSGYQQEYIPDIYREEIFSTYLDQKLGTASAFLGHITSKVTPTSKMADLRSVLEQCLQFMLQTQHFADVPVTAIPSQLHEALYALLDEELILRRDSPPGASVFSPSDETINFTFDEFRDFLLAQYLVYHTFATDRNAFERYTSQADPKHSQIVEGLKRFLFDLSRKTDNAEFGKTYKGARWYADVYDTEVFNIRENLVTPEDRDLIAIALQAGDDRARNFARNLAVRWNTSYSPILNLELLLSCVTRANNKLYDELIFGAFSTVPYYNDSYAVSSFCKFITGTVLPALKPIPSPATANLFRFLILLLPVDGRPDLETQSYIAFRQLLDRNPNYGIKLLKESLEYKPTRHRPYVWRLLSSVAQSVGPDSSLRSLAEKEVHNLPPTDPVLVAEASRFLERAAQAGSGAMP